MFSIKLAFINLRGTFKFNTVVSPTPTATVNKICVLVTHRISTHLYEAILIYIKTLYTESHAAKLHNCACPAFQSYNIINRGEEPIHPYYN